MTDQATPAPGGEATDINPVAIAPAPAGEGDISPRDAARALSKWRHEKDKQPEETASAEPAAPDPETESPPQGEDDAAPPIEEPGEEQTETTEPEESLPPIEPPRSWTKEEKAEFATYPREAQEKIARREQERERAIRQSQNEAAENRKAIEAERDAVAKARQQYEAALPILLENLTQQQSGEFADIKTMSDVQRLASEDFPRYVRWDAWQKQMHAVQAEIKASDERKTAEEQKSWADFARKQDELFAEKAPEIAKPDEAEKLQKAAVDTLRDLGFTDNELAAMWNGTEKISIRDHRLQLLVRNAVKLKEGQAKVQAAVKKPLPPVQRPGTTQPRSAVVDQQIKELGNRLDHSGSAKDAAKLVLARRRASAR